MIKETMSKMDKKKLDKLKNRLAKNHYYKRFNNLNKQQKDFITEIIENGQY